MSMYRCEICDTVKDGDSIECHNLDDMEVCEDCYEKETQDD